MLTSKMEKQNLISDMRKLLEINFGERNKTHLESQRTIERIECIRNLSTITEKRLVALFLLKNMDSSSFWQIETSTEKVPKMNTKLSQKSKLMVEKLLKWAEKGESMVNLTSFLQTRPKCFNQTKTQEAKSQETLNGVIKNT